MIQRFQWKPLLEVGKGKAYECVPTDGGIYCIKTGRPGKPPDLAKSKYDRSPYMQALRQLERKTTEFYDRLCLASDWVVKEGSGLAERRLKRLEKIPLGEGSCSILYFGSTSNLRHRMDQLLYGGHTANYPIWALLEGDWELDYGWTENDDYAEQERELKDAYRLDHDGLPPLMDR
ncbi:MAG: GIY-YIG nuclease family protein [Chloroflexi bacterium]|nr:GIY-YIG nuclease family protein [Chloroflexota bacterium]